MCGLLIAACASAGAAVWMRLAPWTISLVFLAAPLGVWTFAAGRRWARFAVSLSGAPPSSAGASEGLAGRSLGEGRRVSLPTDMASAMGANVACLLLSGALLCAG